MDPNQNHNFGVQHRYERSLANSQRASYLLYTLAREKLRFTKDLLEEARLRLPGRRSAQIVHLEHRVTACFQHCYVSLRNQEAATCETICHFRKRLTSSLPPKEPQEEDRRRWISLAEALTGRNRVVTGPNVRCSSVGGRK